MKRYTPRSGAQSWIFEGVKMKVDKDTLQRIAEAIYILFVTICNIEF
jgi:hypothetical protein